MNDPKLYLDYLDKEMTIMGILTTFCVAVPSLLIERAYSASKDAIGYCFLQNLLSNGLTYTIAASILFLIGAVFFYKQRSLLAWYYGQIALEFTHPNYTGHSLNQWLENADTWEAWLPYNCAFWIIVLGVIEYSFAISSVYVLLLQQQMTLFVIISILFLIILLLWVRRNSILFKYEERLPYFQFKKK